MYANKYIILAKVLSFLTVSVSSNSATIDRPGCPSKYKCGHHEHYEFETPYCRITCDNRVELSPESLCVPYTGCVCDNGYVRLYENGTGPCISEDECPPEPIWCVPNEVQTGCETICPPQTCDSLYIKYICEGPKLCRPGCDCAKGYLRNPLGMCIPKMFCPTQFYGNPHSPSYSALSPHNHDAEYFAPLNTYRETFSSRNQSAARSASSSRRKSHSSSSMQNSSKTFSHSKTLSTSGVIKSVCNKPNEIWHACPPVCLIEYCGDVDCPPVICTKKQTICQPRCICKENHYRNASGICIYVDDCPYYEY
ncbi:uncharacterized protein LOC142976365 [Anticarsia gemmatalis]|uniref:uncharacterized protein LOC142976365 n=1 Tax=Anticarsia gemmatalis TaxID=129554 RepID=UPI003F75F952